MIFCFLPGKLVVRCLSRFITSLPGNTEKKTGGYVRLVSAGLIEEDSGKYARATATIVILINTVIQFKMQ